MVEEIEGVPFQWEEGAVKRICEWKGTLSNPKNYLQKVYSGGVLLWRSMAMWLAEILHNFLMFFSCLPNGHLSPRSVLSLCHLHLYKTGQNSPPHRRPRSLRVFQQEVCHTDATVSVMTSNFSQLATWPRNMALGHDLATWPPYRTTEHDRGTRERRMALDHDLATCPANVDSQHELEAWTLRLNWEPACKTWNASLNYGPQF